LLFRIPGYFSIESAVFHHLKPPAGVGRRPVPDLFMGDARDSADTREKRVGPPHLPGRAHAVTLERRQTLLLISDSWQPEEHSPSPMDDEKRPSDAVHASAKYT
jgi:hypothetical protein